MEQNLSQKERKQRLAIGLTLAVLAIAAHVVFQENSLAALIGLLSLGFVFNYFTCFCGTKKAVKSFKNRLER